METWLGLKYLAISVLFPPSIFFLNRNIENTTVSDTLIPPGLLQACCFWQRSSANSRNPKAHFVSPAGAELSFVVPQQPGTAVLSTPYLTGRETTSSRSDHKKEKKEEITDVVVWQLSPVAFPPEPRLPQGAILQQLTGGMRRSGSSTRRSWMQVPDWSWRLCHPSLQHPEWRLPAPGGAQTPQSLSGHHQAPQNDSQ